MRKKEFLEELESYLVGVPKDDREEIIQDYDEHFKIGRKRKRSESEIIQSFGDPKEIARELRNQYASKRPNIRSEAIETWVAIKRLSKHLVVGAENRISTLIYKDRKNKNNLLPKIILSVIIVLVLILLLNSWLFKFTALIIIGYFIFNHLKDQGSIKTESKSSKKQRRDNGTKTSNLKLVVCIIFNLLFFVWFWIGILAGVFGMFIASLALIVTSAMVIGFTVFALIGYGNLLINDLLLAGLFSGISIGILGSLLLMLSSFLIKWYFRITRAYIELNGRFIRK